MLRIRHAAQTVNGRRKATKKLQLYKKLIQMAVIAQFLCSLFYDGKKNLLRFICGRSCWALMGPRSDMGHVLKW